MDFQTPLIPAKAGTQFFPVTTARINGVRSCAAHRPKHWVPAFAGMSGHG
jgi:hypothetical protein